MDELKDRSEEYLPLRDAVFNTLRQSIIQGKLKPGERLLEIQLADQLGVSRTPVREALRRLELEGLVTMIPRHGARVAGITKRSLSEVLEVRKVLEVLAVELACGNITDEECEKLAEIQKRMKEYTSEDLIAFAAADEEFHDVIHQASQNRRLVQILSSLREQMYRYRLEHIKDENARRIVQIEHENILNALRLRHVAEAKQNMGAHIDNQLITIMKRVD